MVAECFQKWVRQPVICNTIRLGDGHEKDSEQETESQHERNDPEVENRAQRYQEKIKKLQRAKEELERKLQIAAKKCQAQQQKMKTQARAFRGMHELIAAAKTKSSQKTGTTI